MKQYKNVCPKCKKFKKCTVPCYPVEAYLKRDNLAVFCEIEGDHTILYGRSREIQRSCLSAGTDEKGKQKIQIWEQKAF